MKPRAATESSAGASVTISPSRRHGGLGVGLSIAKHAGRGSTFVVRLPIGPLVSTTLGVSRLPATEQESSAGAFSMNLEGVRVLVVMTMRTHASFWLMFSDTGHRARSGGPPNALARHEGKYPVAALRGMQG